MTGFNCLFGGAQIELVESTKYLSLGERPVKIPVSTFLTLP